MSTNKTQNLNLHAWQPTDRFLRAELNENFSLLDASVTRLVVGSYTGDGTETREFSLGFRPKAVILTTTAGIFNTTAGIEGGITGEGAGNPYFYVTDDGFALLKAATTLHRNLKNQQYFYLALR